MTQYVKVQEQISNRLLDHYQSVTETVDASSLEAGRDSNSVKLLAVSKTRSANEIQALAELGHRDFGENYVAEANKKMLELRNPHLVWHFIGTVQSNKTKLIAQHFDWVQSVDREHIARRLSDARRDSDAIDPLNVCIQVNIDDEPQKSGVSVEHLPTLVQRMQELPCLRLRGLMAIPKVRDDPEDSRNAFSNLYELFQRVKPSAPEWWDTLSMGMTDDYRIAIEEGATMVRLGTAIFGPRA